MMARPEGPTHENDDIGRICWPVITSRSHRGTPAFFKMVIIGHQFVKAD